MPIKNNDKLRIIAAFRKYSRLCLASQKLSPFDAHKRIRGVSRNDDEALDLLAVYDTVRLLRLLDKIDVLNTVISIYLADSRVLQKRNVVTRRVIRHAYETNCDKRTVYRQLEYARKVYSDIRESYKR